MHLHSNARAVPTVRLVILGTYDARVGEPVVSDGGRHAISGSVSFVGRRSSCQYPADQVEKESDEDFTF
jgi:hypothetical protein